MEKVPPPQEIPGSWPPAQRAERYRQFANEAMEKSQEAKTPDIRAGFLAVAARWHAMALEAERAIASGLPGQEDPLAGGEAEPGLA